MMMLKIWLCLASVWLATVKAITVTTSTASYVVNTESDYQFYVTISRTNCDITSLKFYGTEYQNASPYSHIASGLGSGTAVSLSSILFVAEQGNKASTK
jgi:rhamnogalacturonan endolyase